MKSKWRYGALAGAVAAALGGGAGSAAAAGFYLPYQGAAAIGNSLAGTAALGEDASTAHWNPAAMSLLQDRQVAFAGHYVAPSINFSDSGSTGPAVFATGGNGGDAGSPTLLGNLYAAVPLNQTWALGLSITPTFGNRTEYDPTWRGRYQSTETELMTMNINPSLSYKLNENWSFGLGVNYSRIDAEFHQAALVPGPAVGTAVLSGNDSALSWNAGVLWKLSETTRFGFTYRDKIDYTLAGTRQVAFPNGTPVPTQNYDIRADLTLPAIAQFSAVHELNSKWTLLGDVMFTQWSEINQLIVTNTAGQPPDVIVFAFKDAIRVSGAVNYRHNENWLFRVGAAFDQSAVKGPTERTPGIPDSDRIWLSFGARWDIVPRRHRLDFAYAHVFIESADINRTTTGQSGMTLRGNYDNHADILSTQYTFSF